MKACNKIILATKNPMKIRFIKYVFSDCDCMVQSQEEAGIKINDIEERGKSYEENANLKALAVLGKVREMNINAIVIGTDSGLEIEYLCNDPGLRSSRYLGKDTPYKNKIASILVRMEDANKLIDRKASFITNAVAVSSNTEGTINAISTKGVLDGFIEKGIVNKDGFGYYPIFHPHGTDKSMSEMSVDEVAKFNDVSIAVSKIKYDLIESGIISKRIKSCNMYQWIVNNQYSFCTNSRMRGIECGIVKGSSIDDAKMQLLISNDFDNYNYHIVEIEKIDPDVSALCIGSYEE